MDSPVTRVDIDTGQATQQSFPNDAANQESDDTHTNDS
jgi:hypothetical protein